MSTAVVLLSMASVLVGLAGVARRARRRGTAGAAFAGAMAAYDEAWHTTAYSAHVEAHAQADRVARSEVPDDYFHGRRGGDRGAARWIRAMRS